MRVQCGQSQAGGRGAARARAGRGNGDLCGQRSPLGQSLANIGLTKAQEAAQASGGKVLYPQFTKEELEQG